MRHRLAAFASGALLIGGMCACGVEPPRTTVASVPACEDSEPDGCENGKPLCMVDPSAACLMCRCTTYLPLPSDAPSNTWLLARVAPR